MVLIQKTKQLTSGVSLLFRALSVWELRRLISISKTLQRKLPVHFDLVRHLVFKFKVTENNIGNCQKLFVIRSDKRSKVEVASFWQNTSHLSSWWKPKEVTSVLRDLFAPQ